VLDWPHARVLVVADPRPEAPALATARACGIPTVTHHLAVFDYPVTFVFEVTGRPAVLEDLVRAKPAGVEVVSAESLRLFWHLLQDRRAAQEHVLRARQVHVFGELASRVARTGAPVADVLDELCRVVERQCPGMHCSILRVDPDGITLRHAAAPSVPAAYQRAIDGLALGPGVDIATDPRWAAQRELALRHGLRACWSVPMTAASGAGLGLLAMYYREPRAPSADEGAIADMAARLAALVVERAQMEQALRGSEEHYRLLFEGNPHPMWFYDLATLRVLGVNDAAIKQYGYSREEFLQLTIKDLRPPSEVPALLDTLATLGSTHYPGGVWRHRRKDGTPLDIEIVASGITFAGRAARLVLAHDITERKRAEAATATLAQVGRDLTGTLDLTEAMRRIVTTIVSFFSVRSAALYRVSEPDHGLICLAEAGTTSGPWVGRTIPPGAGVVGPAVAEDRIVAATDVLVDPRFTILGWMRERLEAEGTPSVIAVPLRSRGETLGALLLRDVAGRAFTEPERQLLSAFADQAALALRNAESHAAALARVQELDTLVHVSRALMGTLDDRQVVRSILGAACRLAPESAAMVWEHVPGEEELRLVDTLGLRAPREAERLRVGARNGLSGPAATTRRPVTSADVSADPRFLNKAWAAREGLVAAAAAPLVHAETLYGTLVVFTRAPHVFTATELDLLTSLSSQGAAAMANARLFARERARKLEAEALLEIAHAIGATLDLKQLLTIIAQRTARAVGVRRCSINLWRDGHLTLVMSQFADGHDDPGLWRKFKQLWPDSLEEVPGQAEAIRTKRPVLVEDVAASELIPPAWVETFDFRAAAIIPLIRHDEVIGSLTLDQAEAPYAWRPEQVNLAILIANQAAMAVDNARLYARVQAQVDEIRETQAQLLQAGKMAAMGQLVAGVAHEINNPLAIVVGQAELLGQTSHDPSAVERAAKIHASGMRAAQIIKQLQTLARATPRERRPVQLADVVERALELRKQTLQVTGVEVERVIAPDLLPVWGDATQLEQVVLNLVLNAEQAARLGGLPARVTVRMAVHGEHVRLAVSDTGLGIPPEILPKIFEPFFTTKPVGQGTGLGLSICYSLVEAHHGRIWAESPPGGGATFVVDLPACATGATPEPATGRLPERTVSRGRVLVIDDEPDVAETVGAILESLGQTVTVAIGGEAGWERLSAPEAQYDVVTIDFKMPDTPGPVLWQRLRSIRPDLAERVVFITGDTADPDTQRAIEAAGRPVLYKPFSVTALAALLPGAVRAA
jgi:PAS domain S-box-containing protein